MVIVYIKKQQFIKNVDEFNNIVELENNYYIQNGFRKVELPEQYKDCIYFDFDENLNFDLEKYKVRKEKENAIAYENKIVSLIRERYNINQELAILRQKDTKTDEYNEYYAYVEECKAKVKNGGV